MRPVHLAPALLLALAGCGKDTEHTRFAEGVAEKMFRSSLLIETTSRNLAEFSARQAEAAAGRGDRDAETALRATAEDARRHLEEDRLETARRRAEFVGACRARGLTAARCEERAVAIEQAARG